MKVLLINASPKTNGATQKIMDLIAGELPKDVQKQCISMADVEFSMCIGCKRCYEAGDCFRSDGVQALLKTMDACDTVIMVCPSWWADVPAQFKAFIDRCTPYADTAPENGHFRLHKGIRCYGVSLRAGRRSGECEHILQCIEHFCGHMGLEYVNGAYFTGMDTIADVEPQEDEIKCLAKRWFV